MKRLIKYWLLCTLLFSSVPAFCLDGSWRILETTGTPPSARSSPGLELIGNYIYLFGGVKDEFKTGKFPFFNDLYRLNLTNNAWEQIHPKGKLPPPRAFNAMTYVESKQLIIIFAGNHFGANFSKYRALNDMWAYSLRDNTWSEIKPLNTPPSKRGSPMEWRVGNLWYFFGGISNWYQMLNDFWVYDIDANKWSELIPNKTNGSPPGRYMEETRGANLVWNNNLILQGGESLSILQRKDISLNDIWEYNLANKKWTDITPPAKDNMPKGQNSASTGIIGNYLYSQGGDVEEEGEEGCYAMFPQSVSDDLWRFDLNKHIWQKLTPGGVKVPPLKRTNSLVVDGKLYVFYGFDFQCKNNKGPGQVWNTTVYVYEPSASESTHSTPSVTPTSPARPNPSQ